MSRTVRASIAAGFTYVRVAVTLVAGLWLVPFVLGHVGPRLYGFWLATGELLGYAGLADFGVLMTLPWLVADADGRGDRVRLRALVSTAIGASVLSGVAYAAIAGTIWFTFPSLLHIEAGERGHVAGPLLIVAAAGALTQPLRAFGSVLAGLQDVRFNGIAGLLNWLIGFVITVVMLIGGYGLYSLAWAGVVPSVITGVASYFRLRRVAPDLFHDLPRPGWRQMQRMFSEGLGTWLSSWGWRLVAASDSIVLGALGRPALVAALACTSKLADALVQLSWIPCDNGLIGLAQLSGENQLRRLRDALVIMIRVYLALSGAVACVIIAANPAFVHAWVGPEMFASMTTNTMIAALAVTMSFAHAVAVIPSVLGKRLEIGLATLACGALHIVIAWSLGMYYGPSGVVLAGIISHGFVFCALAWRPFAAATGTTELSVATDVLKPWAWRIVPMVALAFLVQRAIGLPPLPVTIAVGGAMGLLVVLFMRPLYIEFGPVRALYDRVTRWAT
jgi:O-antigen/teichoic acid export membrane protein